MKILVVEDDKDVCQMLKTGLSASSHIVETASDGNEASFLSRNYDYDVILLDYSLPHKDGLTICKEIRARGKTTPIVFLSVMGEVETKVKALEHGADDYMTKPFSMEELRARLKAISRRPNQVSTQSILQISDLILDTDRQIVRRAGRNIHLTRKEFGLLEYMMRNQGIVLSRTMIMERVWTSDSDPLSNTVESHIRNIRRKIHTGDKTSMITNIVGRGYVIDVPKK